jgi:DNA-binding beta-propeller fold protein YncE
VAAVLGDALHRVAVLGGREGMPRSLGSVYGGSVTRFLGGSFRGVVSRVIHTPGVKSGRTGVAVSRDGSTLLVSNSWLSSYAIYELSVADGSRRHAVGDDGEGAACFHEPRQLCIAPDGFVLVAESGNNRVKVLTPSLDFHGFVGEGQLTRPVGVCANADVVIVSEHYAHRISVFNRRGGALLRRVGCEDRKEQMYPEELCFMSRNRHVAVSSARSHRVSVFSIDGEFIRNVGMGVLRYPQGVACSAFDELIVADAGNRCLRVFSSDGDLLASVGEERFSSVAVHGGSVFAADSDARTVSVFM